MIWLCLFTLGGCRSMQPPTPDLLKRIESRDFNKTPVRRMANLQLDGPAISGTFTLVMITRPGSHLFARVQALPAVGPKLLDLAITPERVVGYLPGAGFPIDRARSEDTRWERHLLTFVAASIAENGTPLTADRVRSARVRDDGSALLEVDGALEGCDVTVELDPEDRIVSREYRLQGVSWSETVRADSVLFTGHRFSWIMRDLRTEPVRFVDDEMFGLELPKPLAR